MKNVSKCVCMFCIPCLLFNCNPEPEPEELVCTVSYNEDIAQIFDVACSQIGCHHVESSNGDLTAYNSVKTLVDDGSLWFRVLVTRDMPPAITLDSFHLNAIRVWILEGAKDN